MGKKLSTTGFVASLAIATSLFVSTAAHAEETANFGDLGTFTTPSLTEGSVTVTGSNLVNVLQSGGLGIVGGTFDHTIDPGETISFSFANPASNVRMVLGCTAADVNGDGILLKVRLEAFDEFGGSKGQVETFPGTCLIDFSGALSVDPMSGLDVTMLLDGIRIFALGFDIGAILQLTCAGFEPPFDKALSLKSKVKRAIPVDIMLTDSDGFTVTNIDIAAPPVINVLFNAQVFGEVPPNTDDLLPLGSANDNNLFRFDLDSGQWVYNLGTKKFTAAGTYTVMIASGDNTEYTIDTPGGACSQTFERLP